MSIHRENGFLINDSDSPLSIGIESARLNECVAHYHEAGFGGVFGSPSFGFRGADLDFLAKCPSARRVWFWNCSFESVDGLYALTDLAYCGVMEKRPGIDYSRFKSLHTLVCHWNKKDSGFIQSSIKQFYLWHFNPRSKVFDGIAMPQGVERLELTWLNPFTLDGLPVMNSLSELQIHRGRNLSDISSLATIAPNLKKFIVTTCGRLEACQELFDHPTLELAIINGHRIKG
jgi:hypothetical protein